MGRPAARELGEPARGIRTANDKTITHTRNESDRRAISKMYDSGRDVSREEPFDYQELHDNQPHQSTNQELNYRR